MDKPQEAMDQLKKLHKILMELPVAQAAASCEREREKTSQLMRECREWKSKAEELTKELDEERKRVQSLEVERHFDNVTS